MTILVEISRIPEEGKTLTGEDSPDILGLDDDRFIRIESPVRYDLQLQTVSGELVLQGRIDAALTLQCARCTTEFPAAVQDAGFMRVLDIPPDTDEMDVTAEIREGLLLRIPHIPLCREDCRGLCPQCGINLNHDTCSCTAPETDHRWEGLDGLDLGKE